MMSVKNIKSEPIKTVLVITVGCLTIYTIFGWRWSFIVALLVGVLGLLSPWLAAMVDFFWMKLTWILSLIVPNILLSIVFFLFLTPLAFISKIFGDKNPLSLKNNAKSLFKEQQKDFDKASFEKLW